MSAYYRQPQPYYAPRALPQQNPVVLPTQKPFNAYPQPPPSQMLRTQQPPIYPQTTSIRPPLAQSLPQQRVFQPQQSYTYPRQQFQIPNQQILMQSPARPVYQPDKSITPNRVVYQQQPPPPMVPQRQQLPPQQPLYQPTQKPPQSFLPQQPLYQQPQQPPREQQQQQQQQPYNFNASNDEDLERKFEEAIQRTKQLVNKYQNPTRQEQPEPQVQQPRTQEPPPPQIQVQKPQQQQLPQDSPQQDLQDLALQYEDGYIYRGQGYEPSTREGYGQLCDQNENEVYSGYWKDNQYHGHGKLINFQAESLEGQFDFRELNNIENAWFAYEGEFYEGKMHGKGVLQLTNGERFEGEFNDGMIEGEGVYYAMDQEIRGVWRDGVLEQQYD